MITSFPKAFPSTALRSNQREVKDAARREATLITDNESKLYGFVAVDELERMLVQASESEAYATQVAESVRRGREQIARGEYTVGLESLKDFGAYD